MVFNTPLGKMLGKLKLRWIDPYSIFKKRGPTSFYLADLMGWVLLSSQGNGFDYTNTIMRWSLNSLSHIMMQRQSALVWWKMKWVPILLGRKL